MPAATNTVEKPDFVDRYFLRPLAMSHRESPNRKPRIQYTSALVETIAIFVGFPMIALASCILIPNIPRLPRIPAPRFVFAITICALSLPVGHLWLGKKFKKYRADPFPYLQFNSARDRKIASWQKFAMFFVCAIVLPLLATYFTFGNQVITRALE